MISQLERLNIECSITPQEYHGPQWSAAVKAFYLFHLDPYSFRGIRVYSTYLLYEIRTQSRVYRRHWQFLNISLFTYCRDFSYTIHTRICYTVYH